MIAIRRGYVFLACAITLQASTWAVIYLLRNLVTRADIADSTSIAFQIAVIVVTLPIFVAHWVWAERLAARDRDERGSTLRRLYLYVMLALFTAPLATNVFGVVRTAFELALGVAPSGGGSDWRPSAAEAFLDPLIAIAVLGVLWIYHWRIIATDSAAVPESGNAATVRRLYVLGFSAAGLVATASGAVILIRRTLAVVGSAVPVGLTIESGLPYALAQAVVGLGLWLIFWTWAERLFHGPDEAERKSALRKLYLYAVLFASVLYVVVSTAFIVAGALRMLLDLPSMGDVREPLSVIIGLGVVWAYHAQVLRRDAAMAAEAPRAAAIRRLYSYMLAAIGLAAFLVGLGGVASVLIRALGEAVVSSTLKEQLAGATAAVIVGLPLWLRPWRRVQATARSEGEAGAEERRSFVRKLYLYVVLLATGVTVITSAVYLVYRAVSWLLGATVPAGQLGTDLAQATAFALIAGAAWIAHGLVLRADGSQSEAVQTARLATLRALVLFPAADAFGATLARTLAIELPGLVVESQDLAAPPDRAVIDQIAAAQVIIGRWDIAVPAVAVAGGAVVSVDATDSKAAAGEAPAIGATPIAGVAPEIATAVAASPALRILLPTRAAGWEWAGVDRWDDEALIAQAVHAVRQWAAGEAIEPARPLGAAAVIGIAIGVLILLGLLGIPVVVFLMNVG